MSEDMAPKPSIDGERALSEGKSTDRDELAFWSCPPGAYDEDQSEASRESFCCDAAVSLADGDVRRRRPLRFVDVFFDAAVLFSLTHYRYYQPPDLN